MELADLWLKVANQGRLTPQEQDALKRHGRETQMRNSFIAGNTSAANQLNINFPFAPIYSEVLQADAASLTINIPSGYKHLVLMSAGRSTSGGTSNTSLFAQYNGDTSAAYNNQFLLGVSATPSASSDYGVTAAAVGQLTEDGNTAGKTGTSFTVIPHYASGLWKTSLSISAPGHSTFYSVFVIQSTWANISPIETVALSSSSGNIKAGAAVSIYGIV